MARKEKEFSVEDLPGVGAATAEKLKDAGFDNLISIAVSSPSELAEVSGLTENAARKIIQFTRGKMEMDFESGEDLLKKREQVIKITTGSKAFDEMLGGGVESGGITEAYGAFGSGKTSLAHQLAVNVQLPKEKGGAEGMAAWIDTEGTIRPHYLQKLAEAKGLDSVQILKNFRGVRAFNSDHQMLLAENVEKLIKQGLPIKLVIVDSLMSLFRSDFSGRGQLADRQQKLNKHMHALSKLAHSYNLAVYVTNQVMAKPDTFFGDPTEAVGGHIVGHNCLTPDTLIQLSDGSILPLSHLAGPSLLPAIDFKTMKPVPAFCNWGSKRSDISQVYEIQTTNKITSSPGHRFFRLRDFEIEEVEAQHLQEGDHILQVQQLEVAGVYQKLPSVEHKNLSRITREGSGFVKQEFERLQLTREEVCEQLPINRRHFRRVLNQEYPTDAGVIAQLVQQGVSEQIHRYVEVVETCKYRTLTLPRILCEEFAQILGYYFGDGSLDKTGVRFRDERRSVLEHYSHLCTAVFGISGHISPVKGKNCYQLSVNSIVVRELVQQIEDGLFLLISRSPSPVIRGFIKGFMDAEGSVDKSRARITIAQKDGQVLNYLQMLLLRFGIRASRRTAKTCEILLLDGRDFYGFATKIGVTAPDKQASLRNGINHCETTYRKEIIPVSREALQTLLKECGVPTSVLKPRPRVYQFTSRHHLERILDALQNTKAPRACAERVRFLENLLRGGVRWEKVKTIKVKENRGPLYDISVPVLENYIANGFVVHNSMYRIYLRRGKKGTRVAKLIDAPAMPENEAIFAVTDRGIEDV